MFKSAEAKIKVSF